MLSGNTCLGFIWFVSGLENQFECDVMDAENCWTLRNCQNWIIGFVVMYCSIVVRRPQLSHHLSRRRGTEQHHSLLEQQHSFCINEFRGKINDVVEFMNFYRSDAGNHSQWKLQPTMLLWLQRNEEGSPQKCKCGIGVPVTPLCSILAYLGWRNL